MNRPELARLLRETVTFLDDDGPALLAEPERVDFLSRARSIYDKSLLPGELLYVGIAGGTGVGKSTLINALAGTEISSPSDKRPFTDRAVVYRHSHAPGGLDDISELIRPDDAVHDVEQIRDLILVDLPDFDSLHKSHRSVVLGILPFLDCVVWVASPEKYADYALHELLRETPKSHENYIFVLNKADELETTDTSDPFCRLKEVLGDFAFRLKHEAAIDQLRLFGISARKHCEGGPVDPVLERDFLLLRDFLMTSRSEKEISSVKTKNLEAEARRLVLDLVKQVQPQERLHVLDRFHAAEPLEVQEDLVSDPGLLDHEERLSEALFRLLISQDRSLGPIKLAMRILLMGRHVCGEGFQAGRGPREEAGWKARAPMVTLVQVHNDIWQLMNERLQARLCRAGQRLDSELLLAFGNTRRAACPDPQGFAVAETIVRVGEDLTARLEALSNPGRSRTGRLWQWTVMMAPTPLFFVKLAGTPGVQSWLDSPSFLGFLKVTVFFGASLFGSEALIAATVLLMVETALTFAMASRRLRKQERRARVLAKSGIDGMKEALSLIAEQFNEERKQALEGVRAGLNRALAFESAIDTRVSTH